VPERGGRLDVGVVLPTSGAADRGRYRVAGAARLAEELGFDSVWASDHLAFHAGMLDPVVGLTVAACVTERVRVAFGILLVALRHPAWVAKQVASLQVTSGGRVILGVGVGGENPAEWEAVGVPVRERGRRTDLALAALPELLAGRATELPPPWRTLVPPLVPAAAMPPVWIGGRSGPAIERAARAGDGWLALWLGRDALDEGVATLSRRARELGRPVPRAGLSVFVNVDDADPGAAAAETESFLRRQYGPAAEGIRRYAVTGTEAEVRGRLCELAAAGVDQLVLAPASGDYAEQYRRLERLRQHGLG
jgi:alkanesulfonate monooxygenase SsuD/methylene tetrahydromethanopterin reductase-like flavin-dependent oxidoreductase (luciferase family)